MRIGRLALLGGHRRPLGPLAHAAHFRDTVVPMMEELESCLDRRTIAWASLTRCAEFSASLPLRTFEEFEEFMSDDGTTLEL